MNNTLKNYAQFTAAAMLALSMTACGDSTKNRMLDEFNKRIDLTLLPSFVPVKGGGWYNHQPYYVNQQGEEAISNSELGESGSSDPYFPTSNFDSNKIAVVNNKRLIDLNGETVYESEGQIHGIMGGTYRYHLGVSSGMENRYLEVVQNIGAVYAPHRLINAKGDIIEEITGNPISGLESKYIATKYDDKYYIYRLSDGEEVFAYSKDDPDGYRLYTTDDAYAFSTYYPDLILVKNKDSEVGVYDLEKQEFILEPGEAESYWRYNPVDINRCIIVYSGRNKKYGLIDAEGNELIEPQFDNMETDGEWYRVTLDGQVGWCDKTGNFTIEPQFKVGHDYVAYDNTNSTRFLWDDWAYMPSESSFIDRKGNIVLELPHNLVPILPFIKDKALAKIDRDTREGYQYVWIDREGNEIGQRFFLAEPDLLTYILAKI